MSSTVHCTQTEIFPPGLKKCGKANNVLWITACEKNISRNPNQNSGTLWRIFSLKKVRQPFGREDSIQTVCQRSRRLEASLYLAAQSSSQIFKDQN
jgi:hypothetical protein